MYKTIIIYGPTAVGKSDIAVKLAKKINAEIISADSMQIYKNLDIGSAKITKEEMQGVKHYLLDIVNCNENYSVYEFVNDCKECIEEIRSKGKNVIICGGTGLYIKALTENYDYAGVNKNEKLREELNKLTNAELVLKLTNFGVTLTNDDKNNRPRLIRYVEIYSTGGKSTKNTFDNNYIIFGLTYDRQKLYERINKRVDKMIEDGLIDETKNILKVASPQNQCLKAIGYKELLPYINNEKDLFDCVELLKQKTRNYAKRQITFMNQFANIIKIDATNKDDAVNSIYQKLSELETNN